MSKNRRTIEYTKNSNLVNQNRLEGWKYYLQKYTNIDGTYVEKELFSYFLYSFNTINY